MAYDSTKPAGADAIKDSDQNIRANFAQIVANFSNAHSWDNSTSTNCLHDSAFVMGVTTRDANGASDTAEIDTVGFQPSFVIFYATWWDGSFNHKSIGYWDRGNTEQKCIYTYTSGGTAISSQDTNDCIRIQDGGDSTHSQIADVSTSDSDGFTLNWVLQGNPTGEDNIQIMYVAIK